MAINIPGLSLSLLRQQTTVKTGLPLLISGRFTAFGMGVPTFIRVFLEGPSYDPQLRSFDTFASPFSGDYSTNVIAEKDGQYLVYAQAFPPPLIPTGPPFPEAIMLLPPIAESTRPPLVVGLPFNGGVDALLPDGTRQRLTAPEMLDIEITPIITIGAPAITFPPGIPTMIPYAPPPAPPPAPIPPYVPPPAPPYVPPEPPAPPYIPPTPPPPPPVVPEVPMIDILGTPSLNLPRQLNVGDVWSGSVSLPTFGVSPLFAEAHLVLRDPQGYEHIVSRPGGRTLQPGETLQIPVNFNTTGFPGGNYTILLRVFDQFGQSVAEFPMGFLSMIEAIAPPEIPEVPEIPTAPTLPTADMFGTPSVYGLLTELGIGQMWQGSVTIPTQVPFALQALPSLPSYPVNAGLQLQSPIGQLFDIGTYRPTFIPGQPINLPVNFDTSVLPQEGMHNLILNISDLQGNPLFSNVIGSLRALMPFAPPEIPTPPVPSEFIDITVQMGAQRVEVGQSITIPFAYTHVGNAEVVEARAAIGDIIAGVFDEVWYADKTISVPFDPSPITRQDSITITITPKFQAAGIYSVYAKINTWRPKVISEYIPNIIQVEEVPTPTVLPRADIKEIDFRMLTTGELDPGDTVSWIMTGEYKGRSQYGSLTISLGQGSFAPLISLVALPSLPVNFEESQDWAPFSFRGDFTLPATLKPGLTYSVKAQLQTLVEPTQETDHDFNVISIAAAPPPPPPPPVLPLADIADYDFRILTVGTFNPGDIISWVATGKYRGRAQGGRLTISLGTGPLGTFFTKFTLPPNSVDFNEAFDWQDFSFRGDFAIPANVEPEQTYSVRARLEALIEPTQETDTDWGVITIAEGKLPAKG